MSTAVKYILIEDDPLSNMIANRMIRMTLGDTDIKIFNSPEEGLVYIKNKYVETLGSTILLLDINMPTISGWEFLKQYGKFSEKVKDQISVYILSSSLDRRDKDKAKANKYVKGFISKPLSKETIVAITEGASQRS